MDVGRVPLSFNDPKYRLDKLDIDPMVAGIGPKMYMFTIIMNILNVQRDMASHIA
jgi:hypothetical protein